MCSVCVCICECHRDVGGTFLMRYGSPVLFVGGTLCLPFGFALLVDARNRKSDDIRSSCRFCLWILC